MILQRVEAAKAIPIHPSPYDVPIDVKLPSDPLQRHRLGSQQDDPGTPS
jgi:hypothetical protein